MVRQTIRRRTGDARASSRAVVPATEVLETRSLLSRSPVTMGIPLARLDPSLGGDQTEAMRPGAGGKIGTISGTVFNSVNGRALPQCGCNSSTPTASSRGER
jgi:hypothetical protein